MKRCLIVDDSDVIRKVTRAMLERMGWQVGEAATAEAGLGLCRVAMPDVVLLDWHLPQATGIDFLNELRGLAAPRRPYVLYATTENDPIDLARAFASGADDYILKPYTRDMLEAKLSVGAAMSGVAA